MQCEITRIYREDGDPDCDKPAAWTMTLNEQNFINLCERHIKAEIDGQLTDEPPYHAETFTVTRLK